MLTPTTLALLVAAGFTAGFIDAIGGGGGLITVPALLAAGLPPHAVLATNKGQAAFGAVSSAVQFWRKDGLDRGRAPLGFALGALGALVGARLVVTVRPEPLRPVVLGLLVFAAAVLVAPKRLRPRVSTLRHPWATLAIVAFGLGLYDGFFGPGTGSLLIVAFATLFGDPLARASGNAKVVNLASNLASLALFALGGRVLWSVALPMAAANALGAALGARLALKGGDRVVRAVVLCVVAAVVLKVGADLLR